MRITLTAVALCTLGLLAGRPVRAQDYVIATATPLTGPVAEDGQSDRNGALVAADFINSQGGIRGHKIKIISEDDASDPKQAANIANKLANDKTVLAIMGHHNSSCSLAGAPIYNRAKLVECSPASSSPAYSNAGHYCCRVEVTDAQQGVYVCNWMVKERGYKKIAVLWENDDYGLGLRQVWEKNVPEMGGQLVDVESYYLGETKDFSSIITKMRGTNPDAIVIGGNYTEAALIRKQMADVGWNPPFFGTEGMYSQALIELGGKAVEGMEFIGYWFPESPKPIVQQFRKLFKAKFNREASAFDANGFDATMVLLEAMKMDPNPSRDTLRDYVWKQHYQGVTGDNTFDSHGDVTSKTPSKLTIKDGKIVLDNKS
jgi:branched-chain amino acid transport system substrate-binding protein